MKTDDLVASLAGGVRPVRRLRRPWLLAAGWAAATGLYLALLVLLMQPADAATAQWRDLRFTLEQLAAAAVGLTAAAAALVTVLPGRRQTLVAAAIGAALLWVGIVAIGCVQDLLRYGAAGLPLQADWPCVAVIVGGSVVPVAGLALLLRRGAPLTPNVTLALGGLAAAALANISACLDQPHATSVTVLLWHGTTVLLVCGLVGALGASVLRWNVPALRERADA
jgi:hypothetical protein